MNNVRRTISYLKRNGPAATLWAIAERKDATGMDVWQKKTASYPHRIVPKSLFGKKSVPEDIDTEKEPYLVSILVPAYQTDPAAFKQMIRSVLGQTYKNWQLVIGDASATDELSEIAAHFNDSRITYVKLSLNEGISANTNEAFSHAKGEYVGFLDHDDILAPDAIGEVMKAVIQKGYRIVYTDEDKVSENSGHIFEPNIKPGFNLDLLLTNNYICHFTVMESSLFDKLKLRSAYDGAQDYDLYLRAVLGLEYQRLEELEKEGKDSILPYGFFPDSYFRSVIGHVPRILYHWRTGAASTADNPDSKRYAYEAGKRALADFYDQLDWDVEVTNTRHLGFYRTVYFPDMLSVRKDIRGLCGRKIRHGRVIESPVLGGVKLFDGMNYHYSGYLHRASLPLDVDKAPEELIRYREDMIKGASPEDMRLVYDPAILIR
ncbi:MAG: glycosyltransferase [Lachnospiraceae bacterium]|nr:glycosyltransferase [Lachnospiraceae bacterium]